MLVYNQRVRQYFDNPVNVGVIANGPLVGIGQAGIPGRSSVVKISIEVDETGHIVDAKFKTYGCGVAIAASARATELLKGKNLGQASLISYKDMIEYFNLETKKYHCATLTEDAIQAALKDIKAKIGQLPLEVEEA